MCMNRAVFIPISFYSLLFILFRYIVLHVIIINC